MQAYFITWRVTCIDHEAELYMCILRINKRLKAFWLVGLALAYFTPALALPLGIIAIVFGIGGRKGAQGDQRERLFGLLGLIFGILATVGSVVVAVVTAVRFIELLRELMDLGYGSM